MQRRAFVLSAAGALALGATRPAEAHLSPGDLAPDFTLPVARGGSVSTFTLRTALRRGPVVLYFFPKAFTSGCTQEAHDFADAAPAFARLRATVVGLSGDDIATQKRFSTLECRSKFLVGADPGLVVAKQYQAVILGMYADRTSYVIATDGRIAYAYTNLDPDEHVANALAALRKLG